jgi:predicted metalloprotease with PDZ domain
MARAGVLPLTILFLLTGSSIVIAQPTPILHYTLTVDSSDLSGYDVAIHIEHAPPRFHLAMATHHEYDDRYWRFVSGFHTESPATFSREDSAVWAITTTADEVTVNYRISLPPPAPLHFSHRPFLKPYGGLVGDLHSFMYLADNPDAPCYLTLRLPPGWLPAHGLDATSFSFAHNTGNGFTTESELPPTPAPRLLDAPILIGHLHRWAFSLDRTLHSIAYLPATPALTFDTVAFVDNIQKIVRATHDIFKGFPYQHYTFLFEDASAGALEHGTSVTIGATQADLSTPKSSGIYGSISHEFFHAWNGMFIEPPGYTELNFGPQQLSTGLWFTEGLTMLFADLITRRTGLPTEDSTRLAHLTRLITRYYRDTGNSVLPPAKVSLADYVQPGPLGDYSASTHLQGELIGACLDFLIRDRTDGRRSIDDYVREVYSLQGGRHPFMDSLIEYAAVNTCQCKAAYIFFRDFVDEGKPIDFAAYLHLVGLRFQHDQPPAKDAQGHPLPDTRVYSYILRDDTSLRIGISNPNGCWAKAGLHTGDIITAINGRPTRSRQDFQSAIRTLHIGDTAIVVTKKETGTKTVPVYISGYTTPLITITEDPAATEKQKRLFRAWSSGAPH